MPRYWQSVGPYLLLDRNNTLHLFATRYYGLPKKGDPSAIGLLTLVLSLYVTNHMGNGRPPKSPSHLVGLVQPIDIQAPHLERNGSWTYPSPDPVAKQKLVGITHSGSPANSDRRLQPWGRPFILEENTSVVGRMGPPSLLRLQNGDIGFFYSELKPRPIDELIAPKSPATGDGYLDIAISNYHRGQIRHGIASYIYLGSREGYFRRENRVELVNDSAAGKLVADLNHDGYLDVVFSNHTLWGIHHAARSRIFWGGPDTFTNTRVSYLPTIEPHQMTSTDIGNIYTRKLEEYFESEPFQTDAKGRFTRIGWDAELPAGSSVKFQVRTAAARSELKSQPWQGWTGKGTYYEVNGERLRGLPSDHRWIQYRAVLGSDFGAGWPIVNEVRIYYEP